MLNRDYIPVWFTYHTAQGDKKVIGEAVHFYRIDHVLYAAVLPDDGSPLMEVNATALHKLTYQERVERALKQKDARFETTSS